MYENRYIEEENRFSFAFHDDRSRFPYSLYIVAMRRYGEEGVSIFFTGYRGGDIYAIAYSL